MQGENIPSGAAEGLREVEVLLESGKAVEQDRGGMELGASGEIEDAEQRLTMAGDGELAHRGRSDRVGGRIGRDGALAANGGGCCDQQSKEEEA